MRDYRKAGGNFLLHYKLLNRGRRMEYAVRFTMDRSQQEE